VATITETGRLNRGLEPVAIGLGVRELERVVRDEVGEMFLVAAFVKERLQALGGADAEVMGALRADVETDLEILVVDQLRAAGTLDPEALRDAARFFGRGRRNSLPGFLEPGHSF
jgi:hypothetical protein